MLAIFACRADWPSALAVNTKKRNRVRRKTAWRMAGILVAGAELEIDAKGTRPELIRITCKILNLRYCAPRRIIDVGNKVQIALNAVIESGAESRSSPVPNGLAQVA
jgi:hypothetical protein